MVTAAGLPFQSATLLPLQLLLRRLSLRRLLQVATLQLRLQAVIVRLLHRKVRRVNESPRTIHFHHSLIQYLASDSRNPVVSML